MADRQETRSRILDAAELLFFRDGISVTGVDKVAATAGVAIVTLYKHFGSKDNLLREVLDRRLRTWTGCWDAAITAADSPQGRLLAIFDATASFRASAGRTQWCSLLATASERPAPAAGVSDPVFDVIRADTRLVTERLTELADEAGYLDPGSVAAAVLLLHNGVLSSFLRGQPADPVAVAREAARAMLEGREASRAG